MTITDTTTIRVSRRTRERLLRLNSDSTIDQVIQDLLADHDELVARTAARAASEVIRNDAADRAEIEAIARDFGDEW
jgi:hypothetical protein